MTRKKNTKENKNFYKEYSNIFSKENCDLLTNGFMKLWDNDLCIQEDLHYFNAKAFSYYNMNEALLLLPEIDDIIKKDYPDLMFRNCYTRMYTDQSHMAIHTHKPELFYTLSICIYSNIDDEWKLHVSEFPWLSLWRTDLPEETFKTNYKSFNIEVGSGLFYNGSVHAHWRDTLYCREDQRVIQTLYHWDRV